MRAKKAKTKGAPSRARRGRLAHELEGAASAAIAGAAMGGVAGPPGMIAGAVIGGAAGAVVGAVLDSEDWRKALRTKVLDAEIGISGGDMGAPNLRHPPARVGAFSAASAGAGGGGDEAPAEGPMQPPER